MWQISNTQNWADLRAQFSWIQDMEGVPQDPIFHAEGDVATHTKMVVEALINLPEYKALDEQEQAILFAAALLHDVEKRSTTVIETNGRITSRNHAKKGEYTARTILYRDISTPFPIREAVAKLVRYHGLPLWFFDKKDPQKAVLQASLEVNTRHLAILAKADILGRICTDQLDLLYKIALFEAFCEEQNCFGKARVFASDLARFIYFQKEDKTPDYVPFDDTKCEVILLCALPGSGKDFHINQHYKDWPMISLDAIRRAKKIAPTDKKGNGQVVQLAKEQARIYLRKNQSFVWNATNITRKMRGQLIDLFTTYKARVKLVYLEVPYAQLLRQNRDRTHPIPQKVLERMIGKLEVPQIWEATEVEYFKV